MAVLTATCLHAAPKETVILAPQPFDDKLTGWEARGQAEFAGDAQQTHDGHAAARITIAPGTPLSWQQIRKRCGDAPGETQPADQFRASAWVRTDGAVAAPGGYLALEFVDAADNRIGIAHSQMGAGLGSTEWAQLTAEGTAPEGTKALRINLVLNAEGTVWFADAEVVRTARFEPWPDLGNATRDIQIDLAKVVHPNFGGVGFHAFQQSFTWSKDEWDNVIYKKWRELNPSFVRLNDNQSWDRAKWDDVADHILRMKQTGTEVYMTTWDPPVLKTDAERRDYARKVVDNLEHLIRGRGCTNIHYYCMSNELSLGKWGSMAADMETFKAYHQALFDELKARKLDVKLLATDASPVDWWNTVEWAAKNMDDITGIYGGHHYVNDRALDDERFYPWFLEKAQWGAGIAKAKGKNFVLGEFGSKQDGRTIDGVMHDCCVYFDTPQESMLGIQVPEAAIAAINGGVYAMGYWTFMDLPDEMSKTYINKWGLFRASGQDHSTRSLYYAYGLLTKFFRGPATVYAVETSDPRLRVAAIQHHNRKTWSIVIVNRNKREVSVQIGARGAGVSPAIPDGTAFRKYVYDPAHPPMNPCGDLQGPSGKVAMKRGRLTDTIGPMTLTVYTTAYDDTPPAPVKGVKTEKAPDGGIVVRWQANSEPDLCYYRIFRDGVQIGSTVATKYSDRNAAGDTGVYKVVAVDQSGNAGR
jgi:hypothetical protein